MTTTTRSALSPERQLVEDGLRAALDRLDGDDRRICGYHLGYWDADGAHTPGDGGKRVRPTLALLSAEAAGVPAHRGVPAAVACELVHNFSLLHDDVMDGDVERRHRPTAWAVFGSAGAILAGDAMLSLAGEVLAEAPSPTAGWAVRCLMATTRRLIAGQSADLAFESREDVTLAECLQMERNKTGALIACSASLGAVLADAPARVALGLAEVGEHLGAAFQLVDDLLGIWGEPERTGKPVLSDVRSRKKSAPVVAAWCSGTEAGHRLREIYRQPEPLTEDDVAEAAGLLEASGGRRWAERAADAELATALSELEGLDLDRSVDERLRTLAGQLGARDH